VSPLRRAWYRLRPRPVDRQVSWMRGYIASHCEPTDVSSAAQDAYVTRVSGLLSSWTDHDPFEDDS
jgi:hypothetical protein